MATLVRVDPVPKGPKAGWTIERSPRPGEYEINVFRHKLKAVAFGHVLDEPGPLVLDYVLPREADLRHLAAKGVTIIDHREV